MLPLLEKPPLPTQGLPRAPSFCLKHPVPQHMNLSWLIDLFAHTHTPLHRECPEAQAVFRPPVRSHSQQRLVPGKHLLNKGAKLQILCCRALYLGWKEPTEPKLTSIRWILSTRHRA